jgi:Tol biopolymer transport system component
MDIRRTAAALAAVVVASAASALAQDTWRVNVDSAGNQALGATGYPPKISGDGRFVVFVSIADGLVAGDSNGSVDVFVHDLQSGTTECVSLDTSGNPAGVSFWGSISDDGRYVAFASNSQTLVASDQHSGADCFVRDRATGSTELASVATGGTQFNDESYVPMITGDGRFVAMMRGDIPKYAQIWVRDRQNGTADLVSVDSNGTGANNGCWWPSISADGRFVAWDSEATNLVSADTNRASDVFVHDRQSGATERMSVDDSGAQGAGWSSSASISADGRYVAFASTAWNLVPGDANGASDVFLHDRQTGKNELLSVDASGAQGDGPSGPPSLSADAQWVAFPSFATNLVAGDANGFSDVFLRDRRTGTNRLMSVDSSGVQGDKNSGTSALASSGRFVVFMSDADNLVAGDTNALADVFVHDSGPPVPVASAVFPDRTRFDTPANVTVAGSAFLAGTSLQLSFGGQPATNVVVVDDATITCTVPAGAPGPADVTVQDSAGAWTSPELFDYTPAVVGAHDVDLGGNLDLEYLCDPLDGVFAIAGAPPAVAIPTPPFQGALAIVPFFRLFTMPPGIWPYDVLTLRATVPSDPALSGQTVLLQALTGSSFTHPKDATWTNCLSVTVH